MIFHCPSAGYKKKWQDGTEAQALVFRFVTWLVNRDMHYCKIQESRRDSHAFTCHLHTEGRYLCNSPQGRRERAVASTLCKPTCEKEDRSMCSEQHVDREQASEDKIQWYIYFCVPKRMVISPCFPNYNINISTFSYLQAPFISNSF